MDLFDTIERRHSYRAFGSTPVRREDAERIVAAARMAPSANNTQPWGFHISTGETLVRVRETMERTTVYLDEYLRTLGSEERIAAATRFMSSLGGAPLVIAVSAPHVVDDMATVNTLLSIGAAIENLLLAATALGLGSVNVTFSYWVRDELAEIFEIGAERYIVSLIAIGYPDEGPQAPVHDAKNVFWYVGSAARIENRCNMVGTIIAPAGVTISTAGELLTTTLNGRALGLNASVTLVNTVINVPAP